MREKLTLAEIQNLLADWQEKYKLAGDDEPTWQQLCDQLFYDQHQVLLELLAIIENSCGFALPFFNVHMRQNSTAVLIHLDTSRIFSEELVTKLRAIEEFTSIVHAVHELGEAWGNTYREKFGG